MKLPIMVVLKIPFPRPLFSKLCLTLVAYLICQLTIYQINYTCIFIRCVSQAYFIHFCGFFLNFFAVFKNNVYLCMKLYKKTVKLIIENRIYIYSDFTDISNIFIFFFMCHPQLSPPVTLFVFLSIYNLSITCNFLFSLLYIITTCLGC